MIRRLILIIFFLGLFHPIFSSYALEPNDDFELIVLLGRPGSGKGTIAQSLKGKYKHLSLGDFLREELKKNTPLGIAYKEQIESARGKLPDEVAINIVQDHLHASMQQGERIILDGFPRTPAQQQLLKSIFKSTPHSISYIYVNTDPTLAQERILGRLTCDSCHLIFHEKIQPPKSSGICDGCSGKLSSRQGDTAESIQERFAAYERNVLPLIESIRSQFRFLEINGESPVSEIMYSVYLFLTPSKSSSLTPL